MTGCPVPAHGPHFYSVWGFWVGATTGCPVLDHLLSTLSTDAGIGIEPVLSCGTDVGVADELDEEEVVDKPGTTIGT